jgi:hypothetical protein
MWCITGTDVSTRLLIIKNRGSVHYSLFVFIVLIGLMKQVQHTLGCYTFYFYVGKFRA